MTIWKDLKKGTVRNKMLTIREILFGLVMIVITVTAVVLLISIIFDHRSKEEIIRQMEKPYKTFKVEGNRVTRGYQYE